MGFVDQDWKTVDVGYGLSHTARDSKAVCRQNMRNGNVMSVKKRVSPDLVSKKIIDATDAQKLDNCSGKEIMALRTKHKKSQKELAQMINVKTQVITQLEQGKLPATPANKVILNKIKRVFASFTSRSSL